MKLQTKSSKDIISDIYIENKDEFIKKIKDRYIDNKDVTVTNADLFRLLQELTEDKEKRMRQIKGRSKKINLEIKEKFNPYYCGDKVFSDFNIYEYLDELRNYGLLVPKDGFDETLDLLFDFSLDFLLGQILSYAFIINNDNKYSKSFQTVFKQKFNDFLSSLSAKMTREEIYNVLNDFSLFETELINYIFSGLSAMEFKKEKLVAKVNKETYEKLQTLSEVNIDENKLDLDKEKVKIGSLLYINSVLLFSPSLRFLVVNIDSSSKNKKYFLKVYDYEFLMR